MTEDRPLLDLPVIGPGMVPQTQRVQTDQHRDLAFYAARAACDKAFPANMADVAVSTYKAVLAGLGEASTPAPAQELPTHPLFRGLPPAVDATPAGPRVTLEQIKGLIAAEYFTTADKMFRDCPSMPGMEKVAICLLVLRNGAKVVGVNYGAIDDAGHSAEEGIKAARAHAIDQIWPLEGYLLRQRLHEGFKS